METMSLLTVAITLFLIMDPVGSIVPYLKMTDNLTPQRRNWVLFRELLITLVAMVAFVFIGEAIFYVLNLSEITVRLAAGMILFLIAIKILFPIGSEGFRSNLPKGEPFIVPLAIPFLAGPSLLATIMLFAHIFPSTPFMLGSIGIAWMVGFGVLFFAPGFSRILKTNGLSAVEKLMGMILVLIAIQRFAEGVQMFNAMCHAEG